MLVPSCQTTTHSIVCWVLGCPGLQMPLTSSWSVSIPLLFCATPCSAPILLAKFALRFCKSKREEDGEKNEEKNKCQQSMCPTKCITRNVTADQLELFVSRILSDPIVEPINLSCGRRGLLIFTFPTTSLHFGFMMRCAVNAPACVAKSSDCKLFAVQTIENIFRFGLEKR